MTNSTTSSAIEQTAAAIEMARSNFTVFKQVMYRRYMRAAHLDLLDRALMQVSRYVETGGAAGIGRLVIEMPPRHGKTVTTSRYFPAWHLGRNPDHRLMLASYGATLADRNSRVARNLIKSPYFQAVFPGVDLAPDSRAVDSWNLDNAEGGADALGLDGGATGKGAHILIIDDPVKNRAEAESETYRERNWSTFTSDLYSRLEPGGAIILMATRWHVDDLTGRVLEMADEGWKRLSLPALAESNDPLDRVPGEALWPARYNATSLARIQSAMSPYEFAALYQQRPIPSSGGLFDAAKIEVVDYVPECVRIVRFYDLAVTKKATADYTVGVKMGITSDERPVILDVWRGQKELPDVHEAIVQNARLDGAAVRIRLEAEKAGIIQLQFLLRDQRMRAFTIDAVPPEGDKYTRAGPFAARVNAGRVLMVRAPWNRAYLDELAVFPGAHDDQVDASSGAYGMFAQQTVARVRRNPIYR
jgi:predicted phage terminase large subunit-like protein